jgi:thioesterase domain-containing protein
MTVTPTREGCNSARDSLELQLVQIWEELLDTSPVGIDDNFFSLGGDSVLAMVLLARVAQETGLDVPANGIVGAPTVAQLAALLREGITAEQWSPLVPIQTEGSGTPFFCVHPGGGTVLCYLQLSQALGPQQPMYGLQAPGVDGIREPLPTVEEMATEYVAAIREARPHGPYALGGWSVGGMVAYEMACRLTADGEQVQTLAIVDSGVLYSCALITAMFPGGNPGVLDLMRSSAIEQIDGFRQLTARARLVPEAADNKQAERIFRMFASNMRAVLNYRPPKYAGRIDLFKASDPIVAKRFTPERDWQHVCDDIRVHVVPGDHLNMIHEPHVEALGAALARCLL